MCICFALCLHFHRVFESAHDSAIHRMNVCLLLAHFHMQSHCVFTESHKTRDREKWNGIETRNDEITRSLEKNLSSSKATETKDTEKEKSEKQKIKHYGSTMDTRMTTAPYTHTHTIAHRTPSCFSTLQTIFYFTVVVAESCGDDICYRVLTH